MKRNMIGALVLDTSSLLSWTSTATAGQNLVFSIQAEDTYNNVITSSPQTQLNISFSPPGHVTGSCSSSSGTITCTYTTTFSAVYHLGLLNYIYQYLN